jgi:hypothetical protein
MNFHHGHQATGGDGNRLLGSSVREDGMECAICGTQGLSFISAENADGPDVCTSRLSSHRWTAMKTSNVST